MTGTRYPRVYTRVMPYPSAIDSGSGGANPARPTQQGPTQLDHRPSITKRDRSSDQQTPQSDDSLTRQGNFSHSSTGGMVSIDSHQLQMTPSSEQSTNVPPPLVRVGSGAPTSPVSNDVPTEELVRLLYEWLRGPNHWDANESLPIYQGL